MHALYNPSLWENLDFYPFVEATKIDIFKKQ